MILCTTRISEEKKTNSGLYSKLKLLQGHNLTSNVLLSNNKIPSLKDGCSLFFSKMINVTRWNIVSNIKNLCDELNFNSFWHFSLYSISLYNIVANNQIDLSYLKFLDAVAIMQISSFFPKYSKLLSCLFRYHIR